MTREELAKAMREAYYGGLEQPRMPWDETHEDYRNAWLAAADVALKIADPSDPTRGGVASKVSRSGVCITDHSPGQTGPGPSFAVEDVRLVAQRLIDEYCGCRRSDAESCAAASRLLAACERGRSVGARETD